MECTRELTESVKKPKEKKRPSSCQDGLVVTGEKREVEEHGTRHGVSAPLCYRGVRRPGKAKTDLRNSELFTDQLLRLS